MKCLDKMPGQGITQGKLAKLAPPSFSKAQSHEGFLTGAHPGIIKCFPGW